MLRLVPDGMVLGDGEPLREFGLVNRSRTDVAVINVIPPVNERVVWKEKKSAAAPVSRRRDV
jgi:hypothetical protein